MPSPRSFVLLDHFVVSASSCTKASGTGPAARALLRRAVAWAASWCSSQGAQWTQETQQRGHHPHLRLTQGSAKPTTNQCSAHAHQNLHGPHIRQNCSLNIPRATTRTRWAHEGLNTRACTGEEPTPPPPQVSRFSTGTHHTHHPHARGTQDNTRDARRTGGGRRITGRTWGRARAQLTHTHALAQTPGVLPAPCSLARQHGGGRAGPRATAAGCLLAKRSA